MKQQGEEEQVLYKAVQNVERVVGIGQVLEVEEEGEEAQSALQTVEKVVETGQKVAQKVKMMTAWVIEVKVVTEMQKVVVAIHILGTHQPLYQAFPFLQSNCW